MDDHHEQRRLFAMLEHIDVSETAALGAIWNRLATFLEVHAEAEERYFYPELLRLGKGTGGGATPAEETEDAIKDHNDIRDAIAAVTQHAVGSAQWRAAVSEVNEANSDHMGEEEREGLTDFRQHAGLAERHSLAVVFATFESIHVSGVKPVDKDPDKYVADHEPARDHREAV